MYRSALGSNSSRYVTEDSWHVQERWLLEGGFRPHQHAEEGVTEDSWHVTRHHNSALSPRVRVRNFESLMQGMNPATVQVQVQSVQEMNPATVACD